VTPSPALRFRWAFLLALLLHLAAYLPSLPNGFVFDDHAIVEGQAEVAGGAPLAGVWSKTWFHQDREEGAIAYRPVALTSLGLDVRLFGLDPGVLRAGNVFWAAIGAALLALLAAELGVGRAGTVAVVAAFSLHPVRSDVVLSIVGRAELLSFAAVAGALWLALRAEREPRASRWRGAVASGAALAFGLLSKETAFAAPLLLAAAVFVRGDEGGWRSRLTSLAPAGLAWAGALAVVLALRVAVLGGPLTGPEAAVSTVENKLAARPRAERITGAFSIVPLAAARLVWPRTLVADYGSNAIPDTELRSPGRVTAGVAILLAGAAGVLLLGRRRVPGSVGLAWALVSWVPFANFVFPTATLFSERLLFLPAAGIALALGEAVSTAPVPLRRTARLCVLALLLAGAARVWSRTPDWRDDRALFAATVRDVPGNGRAWINLGVLSLSRGDAEAARAELVAGLRADPAMRPHVEGMARHAASLGKEELQRAVEEALSSSR
jgi:hypothetical protein